MYAKTHIIAGAVAGYLVYPTWFGVGAGMVGGLLSDIDEPESFIGRYFLLISKPLKWSVKHRTVTHSLVFLAALFLITLPFTAMFYSWKISLAFGAGVLSHMVGDMMTGRIKLLWPCKKSFGIKMPFWIYRIVDMGIRIGLIFLIGYNIAYGDVVHNLAGDTVGLLRNLI